MIRFNQDTKRTIEAVVYPLLLVILMWSIFFMDRVFSLDLYRLGVQPGTWEGLKGILLMPFIHGQTDFGHIINNSIPTALLFAALIYFYREIALWVTLFIWVGSGFLLWYFAENTGSFHIGMSGVIYGLFSFLLISGFIRKYLPLQAIALFVAFIYGSMIWGIFPIKQGISWEGHFAGLLVGAVVAISFRKKGPRAPKYSYEIEQELGIEPPDYEAEWKEKIEQYKQNQEAIKLHRQRKQSEQKDTTTKNTSTSRQDKQTPPTLNIEYHFKPQSKRKDDNNTDQDSTSNK